MMAFSSQQLTVNYSANNQLEYAIYLPAVQPQYAQGVVKTNYTQQLPNGLELDDLNYLKSGSKLFNLQAVLYSAGNINNHLNPPPCMVSNRARGRHQTSLVVGDSGGYQIGTGKLKMTPNKREEIFDWLVNTCDLAMTIDVPVWALDRGGLVGYNTFDDCLAATVENLDIFQALGGANYRFLNVLQGRTIQEHDAWYEAVKHYPFYGWAFSCDIEQEGVSGRGMKIPFVVILRRIILMLKEGMFDCDAIWLHFLGMGDLKTALLLTKLKTLLNQLLPRCAVEISFDTSSPSMMAKSISGIETIKLLPESMSYQSIRVTKSQWAESHERLPFQLSSISKYVTKADVVGKGIHGNYFMREFGYFILENANVESVVSAIDIAHKVLNSGLSREALNQIFPCYLLDAMDAIEKVLTQPTLNKAFDVLFSEETTRYLNCAYKNIKIT